MKAKNRVLGFLLGIVVSAATVICAWAGTDEVRLKNGDVLRGTILEQSPGERVRIQTNDGGVWTIQMEKVKSISANGNDNSSRENDEFENISTPHVSHDPKDVRDVFQVPEGDQAQGKAKPNRKKFNFTVLGGVAFGNPYKNVSDCVARYAQTDGLGVVPLVTLDLVVDVPVGRR